MTAEQRDAEEARNRQIEEAMEADGVSTSTPVQANYFGFSQTHRVFFPDGVTYVEIKTLNEGDRRAYLDAVNREVRLQKTSGDAIMKMATGSERKVLLEASIIGWNLLGPNGQPLTFSNDGRGGTLQQFLNQADPSIIDIIEKEIRKRNVWLMADLSVEDIDKQIEELHEMRAVKIKEAEGNDS
jgi:hypothetical protein